MPGRVSASVQGGGKINRNMAKAIERHSMSQFVLIILQEVDYLGLTKTVLVSMEQL